MKLQITTKNCLQWQCLHIHCIMFNITNSVSQLSDLTLLATYNRILTSGQCTYIKQVQKCRTRTEWKRLNQVCIENANKAKKKRLSTCWESMTCKLLDTCHQTLALCQPVWQDCQTTRPVHLYDPCDCLTVMVRICDDSCSPTLLLHALMTCFDFLQSNTIPHHHVKVQEWMHRLKKASKHTVML